MRAQGLVLFAAAVLAAPPPAAEHSSISFTKTWDLPSGVPVPHHTRPYSQYKHASLTKRAAKDEAKIFKTILPQDHAGSVTYNPHVAFPYATEVPTVLASDLPKPHHTRPWSQYKNYSSKPTATA